MSELCLVQDADLDAAIGLFAVLGTLAVAGARVHQ